MPADEPPELGAINLSRGENNGIMVEELSIQVAESIALDSGEPYVLVLFRDRERRRYPFLIPLAHVRRVAGQMIELAEKLEEHLGETEGNGGHAS